MMSKLLDYFRDILTGKLGSSQLVVLFCALISTGGTYLLIREGKWFQSVRADFGTMGPLILVTVGFLLYLIVFQIGLRICAKGHAVIKSHGDGLKNSEQVKDVFRRLSDWQKSFLIQAVRENKRQWQRYEMPSGYDMIWKPEIEVLRVKGIVRQINSGVFLIDDNFFDILQGIHFTEQEQA